MVLSTLHPLRQKIMDNSTGASTNNNLDTETDQHNESATLDVASDNAANIQSKRLETQKFLEEDDKKTNTNQTNPSSSRQLPLYSAESKKRTSEFFSKLMQQGVRINILANDAWKLVHMIFVPEAGALFAYNDPAAAKSRLPKSHIASITLRKFTCVIPSLATTRFGISTPNNEYHLRPVNSDEHSIWLEWIRVMETEQDILHTQAQTLSKAIMSSVKDKNARLPYWIASEESVTCGYCKVVIGMRRRHTCRDCGFIYCHSTTCFNDSLKKCGVCCGGVGIKINAKTGRIEEERAKQQKQQDQILQDKIQAAQKAMSSPTASSASIVVTPPSTVVPATSQIPATVAITATTTTTTATATATATTTTSQRVAVTPPKDNKVDRIPTTPTKPVVDTLKVSTSTPIPTHIDFPPLSPTTSTRDISSSSTMQVIDRLKAEKRKKASKSSKLTTNNVQEQRKQQLEAMSHVSSRVDKIMSLFVLAVFAIWIGLSLKEYVF